MNFVNYNGTEMEWIKYNGDIVYERGIIEEQQGVPPITTNHNTNGKNLLNYKIYGNSYKGDVPYDYIRSTFIESLNTNYSSAYATQYINTGFVPSSAGYKVEVTFNQADTNSNDGCFVYGSYDSNNGGYRPSLYVYASTRKLGVYYNASSNKNTNVVCNTNTDYTATITTAGSTVTYDINGTTGTATEEYNQLSHNTPICIYTSYVGNTYRLKCKIKSFKIWDENNVLVRNLVPCLKISGLVAGFFDTVTQNFYSNSGTGTFAYNTTGLPSNYTQVEYMENPDNAYIDTGLEGKSAYTLETELNFNAVATGSYQYFAGYAYTGSSDRTYFIRLNNSTAGFGYTFGSTVKGSLTTISADTWYTIKSTMKGGEQKLYLDGTLLDSGTLAALPVGSDPVNIYMFVSQYVGGTNGPTKCKCKYAKWYDENDVLVRDFLPVYRNDNTIGMYDALNDKFYLPQSSTFTKGNNSSPPSPHFKSLEITNTGDKTKNMLNRPQVYTFTGYPNQINFVDKFETGVQYRLSWTKTIKGSTNELAINLGGNVGWLYSINPNGGSYTFTYTTLPTNMYLYANGANASWSSGVTSTIEGMMITKASETTAYEPYGYKVPVVQGNTTSNIFLSEPLRSIGGYSDYIDYINQKVVRQVGNYTMTGSESWNDRYAPTIIGNLLNASNKQKPSTATLCSAADRSGSYTFRATNTTGQAFGFDNCYAYFDVTDLTTFKAKLAQLKPNFIYVLDTPTEESITVPALLTESGTTTTYNVPTKVIPSEMYIKYRYK